MKDIWTIIFFISAFGLFAYISNWICEIFEYNYGHGANTKLGIGHVPIIFIFIILYTISILMFGINAGYDKAMKEHEEQMHEVYWDRYIN